MSKLVEALKRTAVPAVSSIGFQIKTVVEKKKALIVIGSVASTSKKTWKTISSAGLDAILLRVPAQPDLVEMKKLSDAVSLGLYLKEESDGTDSMNNPDFIVYQVKISISEINKYKAGKILEVEPSMELGLIRAMTGMSSKIDAVMLGGNDAAITIERLLQCRRLSDILSQPVIVTVTPSVNLDELTGLCEAGADGIVVDGTGSAAEYARIIKTVSELPLNLKRKNTGIPLVPQVRRASDSDDEEQEGDE